MVGFSFFALSAPPAGSFSFLDFCASVPASSIESQKTGGASVSFLIKPSPAKKRLQVRAEGAGPQIDAQRQRGSNLLKVNGSFKRLQCKGRVCFLRCLQGGTNSEPVALGSCGGRRVGRKATSKNIALYARPFERCSSFSIGRIGRGFYLAEKLCNLLDENNPVYLVNNFGRVFCFFGFPLIDRGGA